MTNLTAREQDVMHLLAEGLSTAAISTELHVSINTTKKHLTSIYHKLGVNSRTQAIATATTTGVI